MSVKLARKSLRSTSARQAWERSPESKIVSFGQAERDCIEILDELKKVFDELHNHPLYKRSVKLPDDWYERYSAYVKKRLNGPDVDLAGMRRSLFMMFNFVNFLLLTLTDAAISGGKSLAGSRKGGIRRKLGAQFANSIIDDEIAEAMRQPILSKRPISERATARAIATRLNLKAENVRNRLRAKKKKRSAKSG